MAKPTGFISQDARAARAAERGTSGAEFAGGVNGGGASAPGVGINVDGGAVSLKDWTVLDQFGDTRTPQVSQHIGVGAGPVYAGVPSQSGDGALIDAGTVSLPDAVTGWVASGFAHLFTIGLTGPDNYGYSGGVAGVLDPVEVNGVVVDSVYANSNNDLLTVVGLANAPFFGNSDIIVDIEGAPGSPYIVAPIAPGVGLYQGTEVGLGTYLMNNLGNTLGLTIIEG